MRLPIASTVFRSGDLSGRDCVLAAESTGVASGAHKSRATLKAIGSAALELYGPANIDLATWSNTGMAPAQALTWLEENATKRLRFALRSGISRLEPRFCEAVQARWGSGALLSVESHVEVICLTGDGWSLVATSSGGLWAAGQWEWWRVDRRPAVADFWLAWFDSLRPFAPVSTEEVEQPSLLDLIGKL